eukprot:TRINITY_DN20132_c0_g1_i1.p1 TRINITY_DN20132_c0_g1~~TRINITY_DN20132_c0_g1_i1.p1  ORF type:complete len:379 (-),score=9.13 TRINITY_DN20132_c0_g1_i1:66-1202(-)
MQKTQGQAEPLWQEQQVRIRTFCKELHKDAEQIKPDFLVRATGANSCLLLFHFCLFKKCHKKQSYGRKKLTTILDREDKKQQKRFRRCKNYRIKVGRKLYRLTQSLQNNYWICHQHDEMRKYLDWNSDKYDHDYYALYSSELPSFSKAGICGHCGRNGNGDLSDPDWIDFLSYVQYKAIAKQLPQKSLGGSPVLTGFEMLHGPTITERLGTAPMGSNEILRSVVGACILTHIISRENDLLQTRSPVLEDIQKGVGVILNQFENLGYCEYARLVQCGISNDQYECNYAWKLGEPAYLKYKLYNPVTLRGSQAMVDEEGFSQDFLAGALQAYLDQCGVKAYRFKRLPSLTDQYSVIEQFTFRRIVDLPRDILPQSKINVL